jgi:hypothetical protein
VRQEFIANRLPGGGETQVSVNLEGCHAQAVALPFSNGAELVNLLANLER